MLAHPLVRLAVMFDPAHRLLLQALLCSLLAHVLLLLEVSPPLTVVDEVPAGAIQAVLRFSPPTLPAAAPASLPPRLVNKAPVAAPRPLALPAPVPARARPAQTFQTAPSVPSLAQPAAPSPALPVAGPSTLAEHVENGLSIPQASSERAGTAASGAVVSPDALREYRLALAVQARRFRRYPALARERGQEGTVEIVISAKAGSPAPQVGLAVSSGHAALDTQALEMMRQAALAAPLPGGLRGQDFRVLLPILFSLDEAP